MTCAPSNVPPAEEIDIPALRAKYYAERDKRLDARAGDQTPPKSPAWSMVTAG